MYLRYASKKGWKADIIDDHLGPGLDSIERRTALGQQLLPSPPNVGPVDVHGLDDVSAARARFKPAPTRQGELLKKPINTPSRCGVVVGRVAGLALFG